MIVNPRSRSLFGLHQVQKDLFEGLPLMSFVLVARFAMLRSPTAIVGLDVINQGSMTTHASQQFVLIGALG